MARFSDLPSLGEAGPQGAGSDGDWEQVFDRQAPLPGLPPVEVGDQLGAFVLKERLGEGGMGTVFRAEHRLLGRQSAIKVLLPEFCQEREVVARFFREAQAVNLIHHPNIVDITDFVDGQDHPPFLIMELLEGQSLASYLRDKGPLAPRVAIAIGMQICSAMQAVHAKGIVHRDLKPDNVFVHEVADGTLRVKLLDFGIAKFMESEGQLVRTATGAPIGTPEYMAPEQIRGSGVDLRTDLYAVGVILFELLTGRVPFAGAQIGEVLIRHLEEPPVAPSTLRQDPSMAPVPKALDEAVLHCLAKNPAERIQSMQQLAELLDWADESEMSSVVVIANPEAFSRARWPWLAGAGLAVVAAILGLVVFAPGQRPERAAARLMATPPVARPAPPPPPRPRIVQVVTQPVGAAIFQESDGKFLRRSPAQVGLPARGERTLLVRLAGYRPVSLRLSPDTQGPVEVRLVPEPSRRPGGSPPEAAPGPGPAVTAPVPVPRDRAATPSSSRRSAPRARSPHREARRTAPAPERPAPRRITRDETVDPFQ